MHLFFQPDVSTGVLSVEESHHAVKVLRLTAGDRICIADGMGNQYMAVLNDIHASHTTFQITATTHIPARPYNIHLAIAPTKNIDRIEWLLEKCTEIGFDEITPLLCKTSERKVVNPERLEKVIVSALKQSRQAYKPVLHPLTSLDEFLSDANLPPERFIAHMDSDSQPLIRIVKPKKRYVVLIGPEGDFTSGEIRDAHAHHFISVGLGPSRLRTETAGLVAVTILHQVHELG